MHQTRSVLIRPAARPDDVIAALARGLGRIAATSPHAVARRADRVAVTFRPRGGGGDEIPAGYVPFDSWRLLALGYRPVADGRGGVRGRAPLAVYRPRADLPGTGRVCFEYRAVFDAMAGAAGGGPVARLHPGRNARTAREAVLLHEAAEDARPGSWASGPVMPRFFWAFHPDRPPVLEAGYSPAEWAAAKVRIGGLRAWPAEMLVRQPGRRYERHPVDDSPDPWDSAGAGADDRARDGHGPAGGEIRGGWLRRGGVSIPLAQEPATIYTTFDHLRGRSVRSPAHAVLRRAGLIPREPAYKEWSAAMARAAVEEPARLEEFRRAVEWHAATSPAVEAGLLAEIRAGCEAAGVAVPAGDEEALQFLAASALGPWSQVEVPGAAAIQVVRLAGPPGPDTLRFAGEVEDLDLADFGADRELYQPLDPRAVATALRVMQSRRRAPTRPGAGT